VLLQGTQPLVLEEHTKKWRGLPGCTPFFSVF
jgi:hypothetical protein